MQSAAAKTDTDVRSDDDTEREPWLEFLPSVNEEMAKLIFRFFVKRAAMVMSSIDFTSVHFPPLPENMSLLLESTPFKLATASRALLALYNGSSDFRKTSLMELVNEDKLFVCNSVKVACKTLRLGDSVSPLWQGPATVFIALIAWSLYSNSEFRRQIEESGLLATIASHLRLLPLEAVQDMHENKSTTQTVWLLLRILFQCCSAAVSSNIQPTQSYSQAVLPLLQAPDVEIRLISKALLASLSVTAGGRSLALDDAEVSRVVQMLNTDLTEPFSFHGLSFEALFVMIKQLATIPQNTLLFVENAVPSILADLSERLLDDEKTASLELMWLLMQGEGAQDIVGATAANPSDITEPCSETKWSSIDDLSEGPLSQDDAAVEFTEVLIRYLMRTLLPYDNLPLSDGFSQLPDSTWFSISVSITLVALLLRESNEKIQFEIIQSVVALRGACRAVQLAIEIGFTVSNEGLPKSVMLPVMKDLLNISMTWTDQSQVLAHQMSQSGFVHWLTNWLHVGRCVNTFDQNVISNVLLALFNLLNCAYDSSNHPAFRFAETIPELIPFVEASNFDVASTAKFTLSCLHQQLDCEQLSALKITESEAEFCVTTFAKTIDSPNFKADGFAAHELLQLLTNLTHSYSAVKQFMDTQSAGKRKHNKPGELSYFDQQMLKVAIELEGNSERFVRYGLLNAIERVLRVEQFQEGATKLLCNLLHTETIKSAIESNFPSVIELLQCQCENSLQEDHQLAAYCCLWQIGSMTQDHQGKLKYARGCYKLEYYLEVVVVCSDILANMPDQDQLNNDVKLLKGKAMFHVYQRKMWYLMENKKSMTRVEEKRLIDECFSSIMETINLLGSALDNLYLDIEGSRLLDWAMMDCIRETNRLNQCERCLLCRQYGKSLRKSHVFPKFSLKNAPLSQADNTPVDEAEEQNGATKDKVPDATGNTSEGSRIHSRKETNIKPFLFGLDKHQMKSAGDCWLWMCCQKCEAIMTQNAENYFSRLFPNSDKTEYSSWLFNYCCTIIFRTLSCVKFPRTFNDDEVYNAFLFCRMHLLSLPVKSGKQDLAMTEVEKYQLSLLSPTVLQEMKPYLLITPPSVLFKEESVSQVSIPWLAPHRLIDGRKDLAGRSHFFVAYCDGISILLKFLPSSKYQLPDGCCISPQCGTYTIPKESEIMHAIPPGLWVLHHRSALKRFQDMAEAFRQLGIRTAEKMATNTRFVQSVDGPKIPVQKPSANTHVRESHELPSSNLDVEIGPTLTQLSSTDSDIQLQHSNKPQLSFLPPGFKVTQPLPSSQIDKCVKLPQGHKIVLHQVEESHQLSCLVTIGSGASDGFPPDRPYVIFLHNKSNAAYIDAAFITAVDGEIRLTQFLLDHAMYSEMRDQLKVIHEGVEALLTMLIRDTFLNLELFMLYVKCRQSIRGSDDLLSLSTKCSPEGCWYCKDLCHCCLKPAHSWSKGETPLDIPYRFCSKKCMGLFCFHPSKMAQSMFVIDHRDEFKAGKFKGPSVLDVLDINRREGKMYNTVDFINLCVGDGSKGLPLSEPYILWQVHNMDSQVFMSFHITKECIPLGPLWPALLGDENNVIALQEGFLRLETKLSSIIGRAVKALGCEDVQEYLRLFTTATDGV